jgi:3-hydroxyisobutyrate dehydrogenase-like beta-hydroxyacid dehydrogenase
VTAHGRSDVSVVGLGPMGRAMARVLLAAGHRVTVWNRTASRADELVAAGAALAGSPADAVAAAPLVVVSLTDYAAMYDVLTPDAQAPLAGRFLVNLSSDTPDVTRAAAARAASHGASFVTGGIMVPAPMVGTDDAYVYYSGATEAFAACEPVLRTIGAPRYLGADPGLAQLMYQAQLTVFLTTLAGLLQGAALVESAGLPTGDFVAEALGTIASVPAMLGGGGEVAAALTSGAHPGDLSTVTMMGATADHIAAATASAGVDTTLPRAVKAHYDRARGAGHGGDGWTSLFEVIRAAPTR